VETVIHDYVCGQAAECEEEIHDRAVCASEGAEKLGDFRAVQGGLDTRDGSFGEEGRYEFAAISGFGERREGLKRACEEGIVVPYAVEGGVYTVNSGVWGSDQFIVGFDHIKRCNGFEFICILVIP
jgi:hypothetical protein